MSSEPADPLCVGLLGPSCSGKTTVARLLAQWLGAHIVAQDDFYRPAEEVVRVTLSGGDQGGDEALDWDTVQALDGPALAKHLATIVNRSDSHRAATAPPIVLVEGTMLAEVPGVAACVHHWVVLECERDVCAERRKARRDYEHSEASAYFAAHAWPQHEARAASFQARPGQRCSHVEVRQLSPTQLAERVRDQIVGALLANRPRTRTPPDSPTNALQFLSMPLGPTKLTVGLMSGTSADGIDAVLVEMSGVDATTRVSQLAFLTVPYPSALRASVFALFSGKATVRDVCVANFAIGKQFALAAEAVVRSAGRRLQDVAFVGSHGQTVCHLPDLDTEMPCTLQIGDASVMAQDLGCVVVSDFRCRPADMAIGGQGAPLVPMADWILFRSERETRLILNIGGIANVTVLPRGCSPSDVYAFDLGPGNMLVDCAMEHFFKQPFDDGAQIALSGKANPKALTALLEHEYYARPAPKSTGREMFGKEYFSRLVGEETLSGLSPEDCVATLTRLTAVSIARGCADAGLVSDPTNTTLFVAGGGLKNPAMLRGLEELLECPVRPLSEIGIDPDAREAITFAILANQTLHSRPGNVPSATGASRAALLGKVCLPGAGGGDPPAD